MPGALLLRAVQLAPPSFDSTIAPVLLSPLGSNPCPPTAQRCLPSLAAKIEFRSAAVGVARSAHVAPPSSDSRIVPFFPAAHNRLPSLVPQIELRAGLLPL